MSTIDKNRIDSYFVGKFSADEENYLGEAFTEDVSKEELKAVLKDQWERMEPDHAGSSHLDHILHKLNYLINTAKSKPKPAPAFTILQWYARVAAILILPLLVYVGIHTNNQEPVLVTTGWGEISAPKSARIKFSLPDGSTGWLNRGSTLKYPLSFSKNREVQLTGQAFFEIKHDEVNKFTVKTKYLDVMVKGTSFDVAAYNDEKDVDVTLVQGSVQLSGIGIEEPIVMVPNEQVKYHIANKTVNKQKVAPQNFTAWKEGKLMLRNANIEELGKQLSRWYNVDVTIQNSHNVDILYRATFEDENLDEVLRLLKLSSQLDYRYKERVKQEDGTFSRRQVILILNK